MSGRRAERVAAVDSRRSMYACTVASSGRSGACRAAAASSPGAAPPAVPPRPYESSGLSCPSRHSTVVGPAPPRIAGGREKWRESRSPPPPAGTY